MDNMTGTYQQMLVREILKYNECGKLTAPLRRVVHKQPLYEYINQPTASEQMAILLFFAEVYPFI